MLQIRRCTPQFVRSLGDGDIVPSSADPVRRASLPPVTIGRVMTLVGVRVTEAQRLPGSDAGHQHQRDGCGSSAGGAVSDSNQCRGGAGTL